ncbi:MAG TPA: RNA polymerase sigma factor [Gemmataceae bacterium]|nr:RNA polymerase sigma factor [Gemmataceae bacterium]
MAVHRLAEVIQHLRRSAFAEDAGVSDGQLLDRFLDCHDESAFAALVRRHGPMVWGVCRRIVAHHQDAEDAFQATFLVLARKAATVRPRAMVVNWLFGVAQRTALKAKTMAGKRQAREKQVTPLPDRAEAERGAWENLESLLDQELANLPDKYRIAIVLCDLEGKKGKDGVCHAFADPLPRQRTVGSHSESMKRTENGILIAAGLHAFGVRLVGSYRPQGIPESMHTVRLSS